MDQNRFVIKIWTFGAKSSLLTILKRNFKIKFKNYSAMKLSISIFQQFPDQPNGEFLSQKLLIIVGLNILHATLQNWVSKMEFTKRSNSRLRISRNETQQWFHSGTVPRWISSTLKYWRDSRTWMDLNFGNPTFRFSKIFSPLSWRWSNTSIYGTTK